MADENNTGSTTEGVETDTPAQKPTPKKQRAPRRQKAAAEATVVASAKVPRGRRKSGEHAEEAKLTPAGTQVTGKSTKKDAIKATGRKRTAKQPEPTAKAALSAMDEMADLIQLEEENKRLRKTLTEKLRTENADLRKRLGLD
jgi:putative transposase